jgi:hypothetical protein
MSRDELIADVRRLADQCEDVWPEGQIVLLALAGAGKAGLDRRLADVVTDQFSIPAVAELERRVQSRN